MSRLSHDISTMTKFGVLNGKKYVSALKILLLQCLHRRVFIESTNSNCHVES